MATAREEREARARARRRRLRPRGEPRRPQRLSRKQLEEIARQEPRGILQTIGETLAVPGDIARGGLTSLLSGFQKPFERRTAREFLAELGIEPEAEFNIRDPLSVGTLAGAGVLATDILTDPLSLLASIAGPTRAALTLKGATSAGKRATKFGELGGLLEVPRSARGFGKTRGLVPRAEVAEFAREEAGAATKLLEEARRLGATQAESVAELLRQPAAKRTALEEFLPQAVAPRARAPVGLPRRAEVFAPARGRFDIPTGIGRLARREAELAAPGAAALAPPERALLQLGLGRARVRLPIAPLAVEARIGAGALAVGRAFAKPFREVFGKKIGISKEAAAVARILKGTVRTKAERAAIDLAARREELIGQRAARRAEGAPNGQLPSMEDIPDEIKQTFDQDITTARQLGPEKIQLINANEQAFALDTRVMVRAATLSQMARGARNDALIADYAERILTPAGRQALRERGLGTEYRQFLEDRFNLFESSQIQRGDYLRDALNVDANEFFRQKNLLKEGENFFNLNAAETAARTVRERDLTVINAELAQSFINDSAGIPGKAGDMTIPAFIKSVGLKRFRNARWKQQTEEAIERALTAAGIDATRTLPQEAAGEFIKTFGKFEKLAPKRLKKFVDEIWDPLNQIFRVGVTAPFPAFHVRNFMSNVMLNFLGGVTSPRAYREAFRTFVATNEPLARRLGVKFDAKRADQLNALGVLRGGWLGQVRREATDVLRETTDRPGFGRAADILKPALRIARDNPASRAGFAMGTFVEDVARLAHFIAKKNQGKTNAQAVESVNKFLFDYSNEALNGLEKGLFNRLFFFYRWNRFAVPLVMKSFLEHPNRANALIKATVQPAIERPIGVPEFIREAAGIPAGPPDPETGEIPFISRFGSPFEALGAVDPTGGGPGFIGALTKGGRELLQQMVPIIRGFTEIAAGQDFFVGRELAELDKAGAFQALVGEAISAAGLPGVGAAFGEEVPRPRRFGGGTRFRTDPDVRFGLRNLPTSRLTQTLGRALERPATALGERLGLFEPGAERFGQKSGVEELLRSIAGVSLADVGPEEARRQAQRVQTRLLEQRQLRGEVGRIPVFVPTEKGRRARGPRRERPEELIRIQRLISQSRRRPPVRSRLGQ